MVFLDINSICNWLLANWRPILEVVVLASTIILWIIRKRPVKVVDTIKELILKVLPGYIILAEEQDGLTGVDKLAFVLKKVQDLLIAMGYGDDVVATYLPYARSQVEQILATPQKKERR